MKNILNAYHLVRKNKKHSILFNSRVGCITTIMSCLLCIYSFKFKLGKHHKISLVIMSACVIIEIFLEIYNKSKEILIIPFLKDLFDFNIRLNIYKFHRLFRKISGRN